MKSHDSLILRIYFMHVLILEILCKYCDIPTYFEFTHSIFISHFNITIVEIIITYVKMSVTKSALLLYLPVHK